MKIYFVRHAAACVRRGQPAAEWHLSRDGRAAAGALAEAPFWRSVQGVHTSPEPKAEATAQRIAARHALPIRIEPGLREVERPWTDGDYPTAVRRFLADEALAGWEPRGSASARVQRCIDSIVARHQEMDVAIVSHGLAITLYLSARLDFDGAAAFELWSRMRFPDVAVFDPVSRRLEQGLSQAKGHVFCQPW